MISAAFVFPHPPVILPEIGRGREAEVQKTVDSCNECAKEIARLKPDAIVLSSPHYVEGSRELDHGAYVPLAFVNKYYTDYKLSCLGLLDSSLEDSYKLGKSIASKAAASGENTVFIASGDLSHRLKPDGPYGFAEEGPLFDKAVTAILAGGRLRELMTIDPALAYKAGECGLRSFIIMAGALDGKNITPRLLSYEGNFGVGYAVASFYVNKE